jgi:molecular chaperone DnaK (HSP70)
MRQSPTSLLPAAIGIDFGTTNSSVALALPGTASDVELVRFPRRGGETESIRSVI